MSKTIKQIADELGVSKQAVTKCIDNLGLRSTLTKNGNYFVVGDTQEKARHEGMPWTICKGFDGSAAIGTFQPLSLEGKGAGIGFRLDKNGETVQQGDSSEMLFSVDEIISYLSRFFTLRTGDLIYTGTPAGIGAVKPGDHLQGYIGEDCVLDFYCR